MIRLVKIVGEKNVARVCVFPSPRSRDTFNCFGSRGKALAAWLLQAYILGCARSGPPRGCRPVGSSA